MENEKSKLIEIYAMVPPEAYDQLKTIAGKYHSSISFVIRKIIMDHLEKSQDSGGGLCQ